MAVALVSYISNSTPMMINQYALIPSVHAFSQEYQRTFSDNVHKLHCIDIIDNDTQAQILMLVQLESKYHNGALLTSISLANIFMSLENGNLISRGENAHTSLSV